jgi:GTP1/Obg family GTP-binding protein
MLRKETRVKIANAIMDAMNNEEITSVSDVEKVIEVASMTDKQKGKLDTLIEAQRKKLEKLEALRDNVA